ncbi:MAG: hypothetical protein NVSMB34_00440 [Variovorax sp.]
MKIRTLAITAALALAGSAFAAPRTEITQQMPDGTFRHTVTTGQGVEHGRLVRDLRTGDVLPGDRTVDRSVVYRDGSYRHRGHAYARHHAYGHYRAHGHHYAHGRHHAYGHHYRVRHLHRPVIVVQPS